MPSPKHSSLHSKVVDVHRSITLLGTSGVGKTTLSHTLIDSGWFHYSGDYRIATQYLYDEINHWLEEVARQQPLLASLFNAQALTMQAHITADNLRALSAFIGKLGKDGHDYTTFTARQRLFAAAEKRAMLDFATLRAQAAEQGDYCGFINDAGGSLVEYIDDEPLMDFICSQTLPVYIHADDSLSEELKDRAIAYPKPMCYDPQFLEQMIEGFKSESGMAEANDFEADAFLRFVTPQMLQHRQQRFNQLLARAGVQLEAREVWLVRDGADFDELLARACAEQGRSHAFSSAS
ncbi:hypothetical protein L0B52_02610 [Suttonella sp. R2A3]|uniref:hypothetical protein n=1 Tax=Suttonella sp. R2A3 TaxID=2908648 RepID=UPI001F2E4B1C|nr:hypothetical protein [Suttonella sp. R2A3]UJF25053.1 hypothetical protein L0B52_02610 [Suttonella sp. R2A3]